MSDSSDDSTDVQHVHVSSSDHLPLASLASILGYAAEQAILAGHLDGHLHQLAYAIGVRQQQKEGLNGNRQIRSRPLRQRPRRPRSDEL